MDVVYFQGPKQSSKELRYSLRSVEQNVPHDNIYFLGEPPEWVQGVTVVDANWPLNKWHSLHAKHRFLANPILPLSQFVTAFDDDMFVVKPVDVIPPLHEGWLEPRTSNVGLSFAGIVDASIRFLAEHGVDKPLKISTHIPRVYDREKLADLAALDTKTYAFLWRYVYGNLYTTPELHPVDAKAFTQEQFDKVLSYDTPYLSSHEGSIDLILDYLDGLFPDPSSYEQT